MRFDNIRICSLYRHLKSIAIASVFTASFMFVPIVSANSIVAINDWDTTPASGVGNWAPQGSSATVSENTDNASDNYLQINFPGGIDPGPGSQWYETVSTPAADLFAGSWLTDYWIEFDFWAQDVVPDTLQVRWGDNDSGRTWANTLSPSGVGSWSSLKSDTFSDFNDWKLDPYVTQSDFLADLDSIDWIGVYIYRDGTDSEVYGIDNYKLMVPEPAEYLFVFAALGTALVALRRKKNPLVTVKS